MSTSLIGSTTFYLLAKNGWGTEMWSPLITMNVIGKPDSTILSEIGYPNTLTDVQNVQANDADAALLTRFTLPTVTSSDPACPVVSVRAVVSNSLTAPAS